MVELTERDECDTQFRVIHAGHEMTCSWPRGHDCHHAALNRREGYIIKWDDDREWVEIISLPTTRVDIP